MSATSIPSLSEEGARHLVEVARCPIVEACLEGREPGHPCSTIVLDQWAGVPEPERLQQWRARHQLPEPWDGHLEIAPILFVSSNPSISKSVQGGPLTPRRDGAATFLGHTVEENPSIKWLGQGPRWQWTDEEIVDRYESAFDVFIADGIAARLPEGGTARATRFWIEVRSRARELIQHREVEPGRDYALTEVVRCKSHQEIGVEDALDTCSRFYLRETIRRSRAIVLVVLGKLAARAFKTQLGLSSRNKFNERVLIGGRTYYVVFLPHPNARMARSFSDHLGGDELQRLREALRTGELQRDSGAA